MRVVMVTPAYVPFPGGAERYVAELANALAATGVALTIVTSHATAEADLWRGLKRPAAWTGGERIDVLRLPLRPIPGGRPALLALRALMVRLSGRPGAQPAPWRVRLLTQIAGWMPRIDGLARALDALPSPDVVHAFNISWEHALMAADAWAARIGRPLVVTPFAHFASDPFGAHGRNSLMAHQRAILQRAAAVALLTPVELDGLAAWGVRPQRTAVIGGGLGALPPFDPAAADRFGLPPRFALFIGRPSADKGAIAAAAALRRLNREGLAVGLVMIGQPHADFDRYAAALPADAPIQQLGVLSEADKHAVLARADLLLLPSRSESFGLVVLEAWAHAKPVVAAAAGGLPSVIEDGVSGLLVGADDAAGLADTVRRVLNDPALATGLGAAGRARLAQRYRWPAVANRVRALYDSVQEIAG